MQCVLCCVCEPEKFSLHDNEYTIINVATRGHVVCKTAEKQCSVHGHGEHWDSQCCHVRGAVEIDPDTEIRIIRKGVLR